MELLVWTCLLSLVAIYIGYPMLMAAVSLLHRSGPAESSGRSVTVVIAARNEEARIAEKLSSVLAQDYPEPRLRVVVASDGSSDRTADVAKESGGPRTEVVELGENVGKAAALNSAVKRAGEDCDVLVFTDARQPLHPCAVRRLVARLETPGIGGVSGNLRFPADADHGWMSALRGYWSYEARIRLGEAVMDSSVGVTGALFAIRRSLWRSLPDGLILDDVYTPMQIVLGGHRVVLEPEAIALETFSPDEGAEFARRVRTLTGNYQLLQELPQILLPWRNRIWLQYMVHKIGRLASPFLLVGLLLSSALAEGDVYRALFLLQLAGWLVGLCCVLVPGRYIRFGPLVAARVLTLGQLSLVVAFAKFVVGDTDVWTERHGTGLS